ncbi:Hypp6517 [Branchiostoma lanceolatum]|uniref:Hypp6517 protein n=1 Tax=Branchiostoma lanceolatum TaxID=7740 RepID=A0A8K0E580_BRALA|nr:Hypp6517 [Branchiostoma lanceolatum]
MATIPEEMETMQSTMIPEQMIQLAFLPEQMTAGYSDIEVSAAVPVHCWVHSLNLCLQDTCRQIEALHDAMDIAREIDRLNYSPKTKTLLNQLASEDETSSEKPKSLTPAQERRKKDGVVAKTLDEATAAILKKARQDKKTLKARLTRLKYPSDSSGTESDSHANPTRMKPQSSEATDNSELETAINLSGARHCSACRLQEENKLQVLTDLQATVDALHDKLQDLKVENTELQQIQSLMESKKVKAFYDGRYCNEIREVVMYLLTSGVSMNKVDGVISSVLEKLLAGMSVDRNCSGRDQPPESVLLLLHPDQGLVEDPPTLPPNRVYCWPNRPAKAKSRADIVDTRSLKVKFKRSMTPAEVERAIRIALRTSPHLEEAFSTDRSPTLFVSRANGSRFEQVSLDMVSGEDLKTDHANASSVVYIGWPRIGAGGVSSANNGDELSPIEEEGQELSGEDSDIADGDAELDIFDDDAISVSQLSDIFDDVDDIDIVPDEQLVAALEETLTDEGGRALMSENNGASDMLHDEVSVLDSGMQVDTSDDEVSVLDSGMQVDTSDDIVDMAPGFNEFVQDGDGTELLLRPDPAKQRRPLSLRLVEGPPALAQARVKIIAGTQDELVTATVAMLRGVGKGWNLDNITNTSIINLIFQH